VEAYRQALRLQPNLLEALNNLGLALLAQDNAADAAVIFNRAVELSPQRAAFWNHQGLALDRLGHAEIARQSFETAVTLDPEFQPGWRNLALACLRYGILDRAGQAIEHWRCLTPDDVECLAVAGLVAHAQGDLGAAERDFCDVLEIEPHDVTARNNLGVVLQAAGRLDEAETEFRAVLDRDPNHPLAASNRLLNAVYSPERPPDELLRVHREWGARIERVAGIAEPAAWRPVRSLSGEKLRIGFVSPDFRRHPVAAFLRPLFRHLDRGRFELYCYSDVAVQDSWTLEFKALSTAWRDCCRLEADALVDRIRADDIDVLVDLAGHTAGNRLAVFARRGAPVQVSWLGYCPPTGLSTIDARLSDAFLDPDVSGESGCVRLAHGYCVYSPPEDAPDVVPPPCLSGRPVTFAAFHHLPKLNAQVLALWSRLLKEIPDARLLVARHTLRGRTLVDLGRRMESAGIDLDRVEFRTPEPSPIQHLEFYAETDLALDCFPWAGHTTACEALWMGVPTVTLAGAAPWQRTVAGALVLAGLPEFIASSQDEYLEIAVRAAADRTRLGELRQGMRDCLRRSALLDGRAFARGWEQAVRQVYDTKTGEHGRTGGAPQPGKEASCTLP
jgi:predicted O-linked N-acetylglucosamine transferase (SPINDLY family)